MSPAAPPRRAEEAAVGRFPAPWHLTGRAYVFALRFPRQELKTSRFVPQQQANSLRCPLSIVMFVDYYNADCGPYQELLFIPGSFEFDAGRFLSISVIYVSTMVSVVNGRANWGIPKRRCDFEVLRRSFGERIRATLDGRTFAEFEVEPGVHSLPVRSGLLPARLRSFAQRSGRREYRYAPRARARIARAKVQRLHGDGSLFPDLASARLVMAMHLEWFEMIFPVANVAALKALDVAKEKARAS